MSSDRHKVCPSCSTSNPEESWFCVNCHSSLASVRATTITPATPPSASEGQTPATTTRCHACDQPLPENARECIYCHTPTPNTSNPNPGTNPAPRVTLRFPWGTETIQTTLRIGRDQAFHNLTQPIPAQYDNVSRQHAQIDQHPDRITITDLNSSNGTYLNNQRITPNQPTPITPPATLRFGANLQAQITVQHDA
jgi:hypothetical protein